MGDIFNQRIHRLWSQGECIMTLKLSIQLLKCNNLYTLQSIPGKQSVASQKLMLATYNNGSHITSSKTNLFYDAMTIPDRQHPRRTLPFRCHLSPYVNLL